MLFAFLNGKLSGKGVYYYANGDKYEGCFKNGLKDGEGVYIFCNEKREKHLYKAGNLVNKTTL